MLFDLWVVNIRCAFPKNADLQVGSDFWHPALMAIDRVYHISPRDLDLPRADFAQLLADRERIAEVEENLRVYLGGKREHVVPLRRRKR